MLVSSGVALPHDARVRVSTLELFTQCSQHACEERRAGGRRAKGQLVTKEFAKVAGSFTDEVEAWPDTIACYATAKDWVEGRGCPDGMCE